LIQMWNTSGRPSITCAALSKEDLDGEALQMQAAVALYIESLLDYAAREVGDWLTE
jgi:hypothetical protein